jgi:hypothetical protein
VALAPPSTTLGTTWRHYGLEHAFGHPFLGLTGRPRMPRTTFCQAATLCRRLRERKKYLRDGVLCGSSAIIPWKHIKHLHRADDQRTSRHGSRCRPQTIHCRSPVQTRPCGAPRRRQGHVHHLRLSAKQCPTPGTANAIILSVECQQLRQLGDIGRNGPRSGAAIIFSRVNRTGQNRPACTPCRPSAKSTITTPA